MTVLIAGLIVFHTMHLVPMHRGLRDGLVGRLGEAGYKGVFSALSILGFAGIVWGKSIAEFVELYDPPSWGRHATMLLVLLAFVLLAASFARGNIRARLRHPMLLAVICWSSGHLLANGDVGSVLLFGSFLLYSVVDLVIVSKRVTAGLSEPRFAHDAIALGAGILAYTIVLPMHSILFGVPVFG